MITTLDTVSWAKELTTGNAEFVEVTNPNPLLFIVSNVRNAGFGFGAGFGEVFGNPFDFVVLQSDPVPPSPGPGASFGGIPPASVPKATYTFPQPNTSFDPAVAFDSTNGLLHILGTRNTPTGPNESSSQLSDIIKFTYNVNTTNLTGPFVIAAAVGSRVRGSYDICVLPTGNTLIALSLTDPDPTFPIPDTSIITGIQVDGGLVTITTTTQPFLVGQWVLLDELTTATFLNGQLLNIVEATPTYFSAYLNVGNYAPAADTGIVSPVGSSLFAVELDMTTNLPVANTAVILDSSPSRSGNTFDGVSLLANGPSVELYYQSHPKVFTFADQVFTINLIGRDYAPSGFGFGFGNNFGMPNPGFGFQYGYDFGAGLGWDNGPTVLTTFTARYTDNRLTVLTDILGNRICP